MHFKIDSFHNVDGHLQKLNPIIKFISLILILITASFYSIYSPTKLLFLFSFSLILILISKIKLKVYLKYIITLLPFIFYIVIIFLYSNLTNKNLLMNVNNFEIEKFNNFLKQSQVYNLLNIKTYEQAFSFCLLLKIFITFNTILSYTLTTSFKNIILTFYFLNFPIVFIKIFEKFWKYLEDFINEILTMNIITRLRLFKPKNLLNIKIFAKIIFILFNKSITKANLINLSMKLRLKDNLNLKFKSKNLLLKINDLIYFLIIILITGITIFII